MLLISPESVYTEKNKISTQPGVERSGDMVQCATSFQAYVIAHCPELLWHWIFVTDTSQSRSYSTPVPDHAIVLETDTAGTHDTFLINISSHGSIILSYLDTFFTENHVLKRPSFVIILENIGHPISFGFLSDCRDFLAERSISYLLACPAESLLTKFTDDPTEDAYILKGDAILVLRHMNIVSITEESLVAIINSCADEAGELLESKLRLCLSLIAPGERSCVLYIARDTLGICFGEPGSEEATVKLISCLFDASGGYSSITPIKTLIRFCALLESGMSFQSALTTLVAQI